MKKDEKVIKKDGDVEWRGWMRRIIYRRTMSFQRRKTGATKKHRVKNWGSTMLIEKRREYVCLPVQLCSGGGRRERESEWEKRKKRKLKRAEKQWTDQNITCFWFDFSIYEEIWCTTKNVQSQIKTHLSEFMFFCWLDKTSTLKSYLSFFFFFFFFWE